MNATKHLVTCISLLVGMTGCGGLENERNSSRNHTSVSGTVVEFSQQVTNDSMLYITLENSIELELLTRKPFDEGVNYEGKKVKITYNRVTGYLVKIAIIEER